MQEITLSGKVIALVNDETAEELLKMVADHGAGIQERPINVWVENSRPDLGAVVELNFLFAKGNAK